MASETTREIVTKRTVRRTFTEGPSDLDFDDTKTRTRTYQVYRGMSPTSANRMEIKMREMEEALEAEREARIRAEKAVTEYSMQLEAVSERLEEQDGLTSAQNEINRKRDGEINKLKKDLEIISIQHESAEASLRKRHQDTVNELSEQLENVSRQRAKADKERQQLLLEIDSVSMQLDAATKAKAHAESKLEGVDDALRRLKQQVEDLSRQNHDLTGVKTRLTQENFELQRQLQDVDSANANLSKVKSQLQAALDDAKSRLEDESRQRSQLTIQLTNVQVELENTASRLEEELESTGGARNMLAKLQAELQQNKSRFEKELAARTEELEESRRKLLARIAELEEAADRERARASKLDKEKNKLAIDIRDITVEYEQAAANANEYAKRLKHADGVAGELQRHVEELSIQVQGTQGDNARLAAELQRAKAAINDITDKHDALARENRQLAEQLRDLQGQNKDLSRQVTEFTSIRIHLETERDNLAGALEDTRDLLKDTQARLDSANNSLAGLKGDLEHRLREKEEELESIKKSSSRALEELNRTIVDIETKFKAELGRLKKKYEGDFRELEIQIETLSRTNAELIKGNKSLVAKVKEQELALDDERRGYDEARQAVTVLERKRVALVTELDDVRALLEAAEKGRKHADGELHEAVSRISELTVAITTLSNDKRRIEADVGSMHADLDEALNARRAAEERADRLQMEINRLVDELRQEQDNYKQAETLRKQVEIELREITARLQDAEQLAQKEGKKMVVKLQARLRELEAEFEAEQRRSREAMAANRKLERLLAELKLQADEDHRFRAELQDQVNALQLKLKSLRRQLEEAEEVVTITMNKYRKAQAQVDELEHRAETAERSVSVSRGRGRSMSVTREITRVVRV